MNFTTVDQMTTRFGEREMITLTDRKGIGEIDEQLAQSAIVDATSEMMGFLVAYQEKLKNAIPPVLSVYCCDIARYRLSGSDVVETDVVSQRYAQAINYLERVASGKITLIIDSQRDDGSESDSGQSVVFNQIERVFGRDSIY